VGEIRKREPAGHKGDEVTADELDEQQAAELPDREAMSLVNLNAAIPVNAAIAANILSDNANAGATATQTGAIGQGI
jgi:uncharacterized protein YjdB